MERGTIPSTDKQERGHGFGLITIKEAAEKLGGNMVCYAEHGSFVMEVMIPCKSFREKEAGGA